MRKILVVGGGQSGLQLALGLLQHGYEVTLMSARTSEEIRWGRVMSTQVIFGPQLDCERRLGLQFWEDETPNIDGIGVSVGGSDGRAVNWLGKLESFAQSVDQRVKMAGWMETFEQRGGKVVIHGVTVSDLDRLSNLFDLVILAAGKGELVELFDRDPSRSPYTEPQRALSVVYVDGVHPRPEHPDFCAVRFNLIPGVGELICIPALTITGPCDILFFEGIPGGPLDCWSDIRSAEAHVSRTLELMQEYTPWEYERSRDAQPTDPGGSLHGRYTPVVRHPVGRLPSGGAVLGMADVVVANDPVCGQGSNNAARCADVYLDAILDQGEHPYDEEFMQRAFDAYWEHGQHPTIFSNAMLQPPPQHVLETLQAAERYQEVADRFAGMFAKPHTFTEWLTDAEGSRAYLAEVEARHQHDS